MPNYKKVIFICKENLTQSPMAEWLFKSIVMDVEKVIISRGLVVLYPEPVNPKVVELLTRHGVPCEESTSQPFDSGEIDKETLIITMNSIEKIKIAEDLSLSENIYTINEYIEQEGELLDPYGKEEEDYEKCYMELKDYLYLMRKKLGWQ
ncbi:MAG: hypothetical protein LBR68_00720 [Lachnoclostridium sp.]|nr:hypothetical protein [Lachnoclostridium sp.]